jgi:hypothetical protein
MVEDNLIVKESGVPHAPFHIIDENDNVIATIHHNFKSEDYARIFKLAPRIHGLLWKFLEYFSKKETIIDTEILKAIAEVQIELFGKEPIAKKTPKPWQDEIYEKHKDEPLPEVFLDPNQTNIIDQIENKQE